MGKSRQCAVGIEVAGNAVPTADEVVGAELHHTERHLGTGISVAHKVGTHEGIDILRVVALGTERHATEEEQEDEKSKTRFHK